MQKTEYKPLTKKSYSEYLFRKLKELHITQEELAQVIDRKQKTVSRYVNGETLPDPAMREKIEAYLDSKSVYQGYRHMPANHFAKLLSSLLAEFKGEITQAQLAERIGKHQKNISLYTCMDGEKPDPQTQQAILQVFYELSLSKSGKYISGPHFGTAVRLDYLLHGDNGKFAELNLDEEITYGEESHNELVDYLLTLPKDLLDFVLEHFSLFYDDSLELLTDYTFRFSYLSDGIRLFRRLTDRMEDTVLEELEAKSFLGFPGNHSELDFYNLITEYRLAVSTDFTKLSKGECYPVDAPDRNLLIRKIEETCLHRYNFLLTSPSEMVEEIKFKLTMSPFEWYVTMLFMIYQHNGQDLEYRYQEMALWTCLEFGNYQTYHDYFRY